jgi:prophage tail gpP-like protein
MDTKTMPEPTRPQIRPLVIAGIVGLLTLLGVGGVMVLGKIAPGEQAGRGAAETLNDPAVERNFGEQEHHTDVLTVGAGELPGGTGELPGGADDLPGGADDLPGGADRPAEGTFDRSDPLSEEQRQQFLEQSGQVMDRYQQTAAQMQDDYERDVARLQAESERASERLEASEERGEVNNEGDR